VEEEITDDFRVSGELRLDTAERYKRRGRQLIDGMSRDVEVDLGGLGIANSVSVAVMVGWLRHATLKGKSIVFVNMSQDLRKIIEFSGLSQLLVR
jgi:anti-anti-sigma factor